MATKPSRLKPVTSGTAPIVGVAITITNPGRNTHVGVLYRDADDNVLLLHLRFHLDLESAPFDPEYLCADPELEREDAEMVAGYCRAIANNKPPIWFAIHYNEAARFTDSQGRMVLSNENRGLNCSTFVLAIFNSAGPALIDFKKWPNRREDREWHKKLVGWLEDKKAPTWYVNSVKRDIGCARVRPEELAGACLEEELPANFTRCEPNGQYVVGQAEKHTGRKKRW